LYVVLLVSMKQHSSLLGDNFYAVSSSLILVWPLWVRIPESLPTKFVNCVVRVSTQLQLTNIRCTQPHSNIWLGTWNGLRSASLHFGYITQIHSEPADFIIAAIEMWVYES